jgi:hypothetical protein
LAYLLVGLVAGAAIVIFVAIFGGVEGAEGQEVVPLVLGEALGGTTQLQLGKTTVPNLRNDLRGLH